RVEPMITRLQAGSGEIPEDGERGFDAGRGTGDDGQRAAAGGLIFCCARSAIASRKRAYKTSSTSSSLLASAVMRNCSACSRHDEISPRAGGAPSSTTRLH